MTHEILINVTPQETRVAMLEQGVVQELHVERASARGLVGNICLGRVARVLPGMPMQRGDLQWRLTVAEDGHRPGRGLLPTLIEWSDARHPTERLPDSGVLFVTMAGEHPEPAPVREALAGLGLSDTLKVTYGRTPRLAAMLRTPRGVVTI